MTGHVPETVGHDAENTGHAFPKYPRSDAAVARLRQSLAVALRNAGLQSEPSRTPHMTMLYDRRHIAEHAIEPIPWTATRFALIVSHVGLAHHQLIDQWVLAGRT